MQAGEGEYAFYDSSARSPFVVYRALVNEWLSKVPEVEQTQIVQRMRNGTNSQYQAALAELVMHTAFLRLGHAVTFHPECPGTSKRPDFLVNDAAGNSLGIVEVTTFGPDHQTVSGDNREAVIFNSLNSLDLPDGLRLGYRIKQRGAVSPSLVTLKKSVENWARGACDNDRTEMPRKVFEADDWRIELTLQAGFKKDIVNDRKIAFAVTGARLLQPHLDLRGALERKGQRYQIENKPYLIVVADCKGSIWTSDDIDDAALDALFGTQMLEDRSLVDGEVVLTRNNDGYFVKDAVPRNQNVSAVLLLPKPNLWKLRDDRWQPIVVKNPFATNPLPEGFLPLPEYSYFKEKDVFRRTSGTILADILDLPHPWPPADITL